jgi:hypothetical protein
MDREGVRAALATSIPNRRAAGRPKLTPSSPKKRAKLRRETALDNDEADDADVNQHGKTLSSWLDGFNIFF